MEEDRFRLREAHELGAHLVWGEVGYASVSGHCMAGGAGCLNLHDQIAVLLGHSEMSAQS